MAAELLSPMLQPGGGKRLAAKAQGACGAQSVKGHMCWGEESYVGSPGLAERPGQEAGQC